MSGPWEKYQQNGPWEKYQDDGFSASNMVRNIPSSAANVAIGLYDAATSPVETTQGLGSVLGGYMEKIKNLIDSNLPQDGKLRELGEFTSRFYQGLYNTALGKDFDASNIPTADAFTQFYMDRYGSVDKALQTLESDPVGALLDVGGAVSGGYAGLSKGKQLAGKAIPKETPTNMHQSAAKFSTTRDDSGQWSKALMEERVRLTDKGVKKLDGLITDINNRINSILDRSPNKDMKIPAMFVTSGINALKNKTLGTVEGVKDRKIIQKIVDGFIDEINASGKTHMTPKELNDWKKKTYGKVTDWSPQKGNKTKMKDETFKTMAKGAREAVEAVAPETRALNQRQAPLLDVRPQLQRSANRIDNLNYSNLDTLIKTGTGTGVGFSLDQLLGTPGAFSTVGAVTGLGMNYAGRPLNKAWMAEQLHHLQKAQPLPGGQSALSGLYALTPNMVNFALEADER